MAMIASGNHTNKTNTKHGIEESTHHRYCAAKLSVRRSFDSHSLAQDDRDGGFCSEGKVSTFFDVQMEKQVLKYEHTFGKDAQKQPESGDMEEKANGRTQDVCKDHY